VDTVEGGIGGIVVRAGSSAGWAYGVVEAGPVERAPGFAVAEDGRIVCEFEPGLEHERSGTDPDRLLPALRRAGLVLTDGRTPFDHGVDLPDEMERVLATAEREFGLDLPRQAVLDGGLSAGALSVEERPQDGRGAGSGIDPALLQQDQFADGRPTDR